MKSRFRVVVQWTIIAVFAVFAVRYLYTQWQQIDLTGKSVSWPTLILAQLLYCAGLGVMPLGAWLMQRWFGYALTPMITWRSFYLAQLSKYMPGGIWSLVGRVFLYRQSGVTPVDSTALMLLEVIGLVFGACAVGLLSLPVFLPLLDNANVPAVFLLTVGFLAGVGILYLTRSRWMFAFKSVRLVPFIGVCALYALDWVLIGFAFGTIALAFDLTLQPIDMLVVIGIHAVAWLIGFLVVFAPGGIGVRDVVLAVGLAAFFQSPFPLLVSLTARIAWTLAEVFDFVFVTLLRWGMRRFGAESEPGL